MGAATAEDLGWHLTEAKDLIVGLQLRVADVLSLAAALANGADLLTEDEHLLRPAVLEVGGKQGLRVLRLQELCQQLA